MGPVLKGHEHPISHIRFSKDGSRVIADEDHGLEVIKLNWDTISGELLSRTKIRLVSQPSATVMGLPLFFKYDLPLSERGELARRFGVILRRWEGHPRQDSLSTESKTAFMGGWTSRSGHRLVTSMRDYSLHIWDSETGALLSVIRAMSDRLENVAFFPDGKRVLTVWSFIHLLLLFYAATLN
jgi:WD40 repeat protein